MEPLDLFLQDQEGHFKRLSLALNAHSFEEIRRLLHTIKGNADIFGFAHLVKYVHTLEWFVQKIQAGVIKVDAHTLKFLETTFLNLQGALAIYRVDPQNPLTLKEKIAEVLQFIRGRVSAAPVLEVEASVEAIPIEPEIVPEIVSEDDAVEYLQVNIVPPKPLFFLHILQGGQDTYVPCHRIVRVLRKVSLLTIRTTEGEFKALARINGQLVPVRSFENEVPSREWALLIRDPLDPNSSPSPMASESNDKTYCLMADEILGVTEMLVAPEDQKGMLSKSAA